MTYWSSVEKYLESTVGRLPIEFAVNSLLMDSFHNVCRQIKKSLKDCFILEREKNIIYLRPFQDIFVTAPENEKPSTCVWCGGYDYLLEDILSMPLFTYKK
jgi:hypothetical protein